MPFTVTRTEDELTGVDSNSWNLVYTYERSNGDTRTVYPHWRLRLLGVVREHNSDSDVIEDCVELRVTHSVQDVMSKTDIELSSPMNYQYFGITSSRNIIVEQALLPQPTDPSDSQYVEVFRGILDDRFMSETSRKCNFTNMSRDNLAKLAHPWFNTLMTKQWRTKVYISEIIAFCVATGSLKCKYSAFDWYLPNFDTSGQYPIDIIKMFADKIYAKVQTLNDTVYISPKIPTQEELNNPILTFWDNNDIVFLSEKNVTDQYFNRVAVIGNLGNYDNINSGEGEFRKVVDYEPLALNEFFKQPEIPTINGEEVEDYEEAFDDWAEENANTMGADVLDSLDFEDVQEPLPTAVKQAPLADRYTNENPVFFERTFINTGKPINPDTIEVHGGRHTVELNGRHTYSDAKYVDGSYGINQGKIRIPYTLTENPDYQEWALSTTIDNCIVSQSLMDKIVNVTPTGSESIDAVLEATAPPLEGAIDKLSVEFADGEIPRWYYLRERKAQTLIIRVWGTSETIGGMLSGDNYQYEDISQRQLNDEDPLSPLMYPNIDTDYPPDGPGRLEAPDFDTDTFTKVTNQDGIAYFPEIPIVSVAYTRTVTKPGYDFKDSDDSSVNPSVEVLENTYKYANSSSSNPSLFKYIIQDTKYNWIVTAMTTEEPYGPPTPIPNSDWNGTLIVDKASEIISFGRAVEPLMPIEDPIITEKAVAYYIGNGFVNWAVAQKVEIVVKIPSVPLRLDGKVIRIVDSRMSIDLNLYVVSQVKTLEKGSCWDELTTIKFVLD